MANKYTIPHVKTFEFTKIIGIENINFGKNIIIDDFVLIYAKEKIQIGNYVHISSFSSISGGGTLIIEDFSAISSGSRILTGTDDFKEWGFGNSTISNDFRNIIVKNIHIQKFVIIGANSVILPGVTIGEGSVITKNLEPWGIYIGNKQIGWRDKNAVLKNFEKFNLLPEDKKSGNLFRV